MCPPPKYHLNAPAGLYTLDGETTVYPDFEPWKHRPVEDSILVNSVSKGYYQPPRVSFETISGKSTIIQEPLQNLASRLSANFDEIFKLREENINKIKNASFDESSHHANSFFYNLSGEYFKLPRRVTLTDAKREQWLQDLTNSDVKMEQLIKSIPHGFKRKQLLEQLYMKQIPFSRAIWLIKYCYCIEWSVLSSRASDSSEYSSVVSKIYQEWTSAMVQMLEKLVFEMSTGENHSIPTANQGSYSQANLNRNFSRSSSKSQQPEHASHQTTGSTPKNNLSTNSLMETHIFSNSTVDADNTKYKSRTLYNNTSSAQGHQNTDAKNNKHSREDLEKLLSWKSKMKYYLKFVGNCYGLGLLDKYLFINWLVEFFSKMENFEYYPISLHILTNFWDDIMENENTDIFIIGKVTESLLHSYHNVTQSKSMLNDSNFLINDVKKNEKIKNVFLSTLQKLIFRVFHHKSLEVFVIVDTNKWDVYKFCLEQILDIHNPATSEEVKKKFELITYRNDTLKRSFEGSHSEAASDFILRINDKQNMVMLKTNFDLINLLDNNKISDNWDSFVSKMDADGMIHMLLWAVSPNRKTHYENIHLVARLLIMKLSSEDKQDFDIEDDFWRFIFLLAKANNVDVYADFQQLKNLVNTFIVYGIVKVPTYIRKVISSGVLYSPTYKVKSFHSRLLINLKIQPVMKYQFNMVLKNIDEEFLYPNFKYEQLINLAENCKNVFITNSLETETLQDVPGSVKIMVADWYLNDLMSSVGSQDEEPLIVAETVKRVFTHLCEHLEQAHHFYRWLEFIVYHQQISNIGAMEQMIDILLAYQRFFPLLINDTNTFMKSIINLYLNKLKSIDMHSFQIIKFNSFWKFFLVHFESGLNLDPCLKLQLNELCEIENERLREYSKENHQLSLSSNQQLNKKFRDLLNSQESHETCQAIRLEILSLQIVSSQDYSKYVSFILKRRKMEIEDTHKFSADLVFLLSLKLISLEFVTKVFGMNIIIQVIKSGAKDPYFVFHRQHYIKQNYEHILKWCVENNDTDYLIFLIATYGESSSRIKTSRKHLRNVILCKPELVFEALHRNLQENVYSIDDYASIFESLNFSNLYIIQVFVECLMCDPMLLAEQLGTVSCKVLSIMKFCQYNYLYAHLFDTVENYQVLNNVLDVINTSFLNSCFINGNDEAYLCCNKTAIINLSKILKAHDVLHISEKFFQTFESLMKECLKLSLNESSMESKIFNILIEFLIIYERSLFDCIIRSNNTTFIPLLATFFQNKLELPLKTKLFIYDILHNLKSQYTYSSTLDPLKLDQIPTELIELPPFRLSSFSVSPPLKTSTESPETMGITFTSCEKTRASKRQDVSGGYYLYNKKLEKYGEIVEIPEFIALANYADDKNIQKLNTTFINLSLFDAKLDRKNIA